MQINSIGTGASAAIPNQQGAGLTLPVESSDSFGQILSNALDEVNQEQLNAAQKVEQFSEGKNMDVHDLMITVEKANIALDMAVQVRNQIVNAYQQVMQMQV
ncbi:MAG: flagellar hook-basal body complex protein FliE [Armatimonadetes bacterium]|nr:flagellar hook-basal body complex protein FliE [Armatimonadota bacterium]